MKRNVHNMNFVEIVRVKKSLVTLCINIYHKTDLIPVVSKHERVKLDKHERVKHEQCNTWKEPQ